MEEEIAGGWWSAVIGGLDSAAIETSQWRRSSRLLITGLRECHTSILTRRLHGFRIPDSGRSSCIQMSSFQSDWSQDQIQFQFQLDVGDAGDAGEVSGVL